MQSYSEAFFPTEISNMTFAATCLLFAGSQSTLTFKMYKKRDKFYQKYLRDEFLFKRITINRLTTENPKNVREKVIIVTLYYVYWVIRYIKNNILFGFIIHLLRNG